MPHILIPHILVMMIFTPVGPTTFEVTELDSFEKCQDAGKTFVFLTNSKVHKNFGIYFCKEK